MTRLGSFRAVLWGLVVLVALAAAGLYFFRPPAAAFGGGDYALLDGTNRPFIADSLKGRPTMLFFGYTHCPDVCPTTLAEMASWFEALGDQGKPLRAFFVTVDPERDSPAIINDYVHAVSDRITGVSGSRPEIDKMLKAWGIYAKKVPLKGDDYSMDHTATVFLLNSQGGFEGTIAYQEDQSTAIQKLKNLIAKG
ncbi:MAG: SCO family protein [Devosia sp.]|nr:SCO family protein [Devosia sp.]